MEISTQATSNQALHTQRRSFRGNGEEQKGYPNNIRQKITPKST